MAPAFSHLSRDDIKRLETENGFRQAELADNMIHAFLDPEMPFKLRPSHLTDQNLDNDRVVVADGDERLRHRAAYRRFVRQRRWAQLVLNATNRCADWDITID